MKTLRLLIFDLNLWLSLKIMHLVSFWPTLQYLFYQM
nr:MAG TPA: hypothetical protein [Caudoviricetes sp.]